MPITSKVMALVVIHWFADSGDHGSNDGFELLAWDAGDGASGCVDSALVGGEVDRKGGGFELGLGHAPRISQKCLMVTEASPKASDSRSDALSCSRCSRMCGG